MQRSNNKEQEERMTMKGATKLQRSAPELSNDVNKLCEEYVKQSVLFAQEFVKLAGLPDEKAPDVENMIIGRCSEAVSMARLCARGWV